jgi:hypothetical protein
MHGHPRRPQQQTHRGGKETEQTNYANEAHEWATARLKGIPPPALHPFSFCRSIHATNYNASRFAAPASVTDSRPQARASL